MVCNLCNVIPEYQTALTQSGYNYQLSYTEPKPAKHNKRKRKTLWFNPPYSKSVATNIGKQFFKILDSEFPPTHKLHKILNRNTVKLSYSCCANVDTIIKAQNKHISTQHPTPPTKQCNCRDPSFCPLDGKCLTTGIVYRATVKTDNNSHPEETYVGLTENAFKTRYSNHKSSFNNISKRNSTELSKYIWSLKENYNIQWEVVRWASAYSPASKHCNLCSWEKYYIIYELHTATLNNRNELISTCRHARKYYLGNIT